MSVLDPPKWMWTSSHCNVILALQVLVLNLCVGLVQGLYSLRRCCLTGIGIPIINLRQSDDRLRFIMRLPILIRPRLLSEQRPWANMRPKLDIAVPVDVQAPNGVGPTFLINKYVSYDAFDATLANNISHEYLLLSQYNLKCQTRSF